MIKYIIYWVLGLLLCGNAAAAATDTLITVIRDDESFPANITALQQQSFTGSDPAGACSYIELVENAKSTARSIGANIVKINKHTERSQKVYCDEIRVSFYKVADITPYEKRFSWRQDRKLVWDDFKGSVPANAAAKTAAETSCGIAIETNTVNSKTPVKIYIFNTFVTNSSWVRTQQKNDHILKHEQGHFDICELFTRKMRERFSKVTMDVKNMQSVIRDIYNKTMSEYADMQRDYEQETQHGVVEDAQARWLERIAKEMVETEGWKSV